MSDMQVANLNPATTTTAATTAITSVTVRNSSRVKLQSSTLSEQEAARAELVQSGVFKLVDGPAGPYALEVWLEAGHFGIDARAGDQRAQISIGLGPMRALIRDYFEICESYYDTVRERPLQLEVIDMGRRGVHNEASQALQDLLASQVDLDHDTSRRLFTLLCTLQFGR
jgi:uncharacterized protein (UPF0262 family)